MLSYAKLSRSQVISCHLRDIGGYLITVGYICYHGNNHGFNNEWRLGGMTIVKQQGMEVLGVNLSLSVSFKDRRCMSSRRVECMPNT